MKSGTGCSRNGVIDRANLPQRPLDTLLCLAESDAFSIDSYDPEFGNQANKAYELMFGYNNGSGRKTYQYEAVVGLAYSPG